MDFKIPIGQTFVGRVFACAKLIICDDLAQSDELDCKMLSEHGMGTCMDAPMVHNGVCIGTLNVADINVNITTPYNKQFFYRVSPLG
jgi:hypothetical protein